MYKNLEFSKTAFFIPGVYYMKKHILLTLTFLLASYAHDVNAMENPKIAPLIVLSVWVGFHILDHAWKGTQSTVKPQSIYQNETKDEKYEAYDKN